MSGVWYMRICALATAALLCKSAYSASLDGVQQNPDPLFLKELSARIGCDDAAQWVAMPETGADQFTATLSTMKSEAKKREGREDRARSWYSLIKKHLFNTKKIAEQCRREPSAVKEDGIAMLASKYPDGLTVVALGGFGSHSGSEGTLTTSFAQWQKSNANLVASKKIDFVRVECSFSYSPDETFCADDMLHTLQESIKRQDPSGKHKLLLWGYSKGGLSAVEMLRKSSWLRDQTVAVISVGSPFQGSMLIDRMAPAVDAFVESSRIPGTSETMGADTVMKLLQMWVGGARTDIDEIMTNFGKVREGVHSLTTKSRADYLKRKLIPNNFLRSNGSKIQVFQIAGIIDPSRVLALPVMRVKGGKLFAVDHSHDPLHTAQATAMMSATAKPLSDSCVALEDALLPVEPAHGSGLDSQFLALVRLDHLGLRFHRMATEVKHGVPDHAIVDAAIATVARRIQP